MKIKDKIEKLRQKINECNDYYYSKNISLISDKEFDTLLSELKSLEEKYPEYKNTNSPTEVVGKIDLKGSKFTKVTHKKPMLSLSNSYNEKDIFDFTERVKKLLPENEVITYALELKLDGLSISVQYEKGVLTRAVTRGDGTVGEDVTENIIQIPTIPKKLNKNIDFEIRGEVVLPISKFEQLNQKRLENGEDVFANPRNAASGTLRQLDSSIIKERGLDAYFYFIVDAEKLGFKTHKESIDFLDSIGIKTTNVCEVLKTPAELMKRISYWGEKRENLDYETDGMVIKVNELNLWDKLGFTTKSPRWAIAFKFPAKQATSKILDVTWQVGRTGKITPVAELKEVELSGSKVKRASLHNFQEIERKDIRIGDSVFIEKAAEIIPQVVSSIKELRTGKEKQIHEPENCPICNAKIIRIEKQVDIKCPNASCPGKIEGEIIYFVSRDAMNIVGFGTKLVENMIRLGFIKNISDIYRLKEHQTELEQLEKMGKKSVEKLLQAIENSKTRDYPKVLCALGIPFVGKTSAKLLAKKSKNIDILMKMSVEDLMLIEGIGEKMAFAIFNFFKDSEKIKLIEELKNFGLQFYSKKSQSNTNEKQIFSGKTFLFTGTLKNFKRNEIKEKIEELGGKNLSSVSKNLDYLIVGEKAGSKLKKAEEIGSIKIISEEEFINMYSKN